jgi:hypothetical protein
MFFYTSLLVASVIVAFVVLWLYKAILDAGRVIYKAMMLPSSKDGPTDHLAIRTMCTTINDTPMPWGWKSDQTPRQAARVHYKVTRKVKPSRSNLKTTSKPWGW